MYQSTYFINAFCMMNPWLHYRSIRVSQNLGFWTGIVCGHAHRDIICSPIPRKHLESSVLHLQVCKNRSRWLYVKAYNARKLCAWRYLDCNLAILVLLTTWVSGRTSTARMHIATSNLTQFQANIHNRVRYIYRHAEIWVAHYVSKHLLRKSVFHDEPLAAISQYSNYPPPGFLHGLCRCACTLWHRLWRNTKQIHRFECIL